MKLYQAPEFKSLRQKLRNSGTETERALWKVLRRKQILGYKFIRQYGVGRFVLDFYCPELRLSIELDGSQHLKAGNAEDDKQRTHFLKEKNITELRFFDNEVFNNLDGIADKIIFTIKKIVK